MFKGWAAIAAALSFVTAPVGALPRPMIVPPAANVPLPDATYERVVDVAIDGEWLIMSAEKYLDGGDMLAQAAFLFQRTSAGSWTFVSTLATSEMQPVFADPMTVAIQGGLAAVNGVSSSIELNWLHFFELGPTGWVRAPGEANPDSTDIEIDAGTVIASTGNCSWDAGAYRKNAEGVYTAVHTYRGYERECDDEFKGDDIDISGTSVVVRQPSDVIDGRNPAVHIYEGIPPLASPAVIENPEPGLKFAPVAAVEGDTLAAAASPLTGLHLFTRDAPGAWTPRSSVITADALNLGFWSHVRMKNGFIFHGRGGYIDVYRPDAAGELDHVARLDGCGFCAEPGVSGRDVAALARDAKSVNVYTLPSDFTRPAMRQDDFQDGNAGEWAPQAGSSYAVAPSSSSLVYRQSSLAGSAISVLTNSHGTDQAIQADVTPTAFNGTDRWFGLIARYNDAGNYYYITVRRSNVIQIRKLVNGAFQTLASAPLSVALNRTYNLRMEVIGTSLRAYVDGKRVLEARDSAHAEGSVALMTYKTTADYDNVLTGPSQLTWLLTDDFTVDPNLLNPRPYNTTTWMWTPDAGSWALTTDGTSVYTQTSIEGSGRAVTGIATEDQIIEARVKATAFSGTGRWVGVMARYIDSSNYYYVTLRNDNTISLRKLVNGAITVLDSAPLTVTTGAWYTVRLEAIGNALRVFVNGTHVLEANDATHPAGRYGAVTYKAAARYDDVRVVQP